MRARTRAAGAAILAILGGVQTPLAAETVRPVFGHELPDADDRSITVAEVDFAPGNKADPHRHGDAFVYAYVLSGSVRSQLAGGPARTYRTGQGWFEPPGARHLLTENASHTTRARLFVVFIARTGASLKTPASPTGAQEMHQQSQLLSHAPSAPPAAAPPPTPRKMVDALYSAFGDNHSRAVHAKGTMAIGTFEPAASAAGISRATIFSQGTLPILVRFSNFTGIPTIPDTVGDANPRGLALKIQMPDGSSADIVAHSFNGFPTATSAEFRELLLAIGASGAGASKPTALDAFLAAHPIAKTFLTTQKPAPKSYATLSYFGVNAFRFTDATGRARFVRYRFVPVGGEAVLPPERLATAGPDYLRAELPTRLARSPIAFDWYAQIAEATDVIGDPSIAWPESRQLVRLGTIRIDRMVPDPVTTDKGTLFLPLNVPEGIEPADPMLGIRQGAYPLSFQHRQ